MKTKLTLFVAVIAVALFGVGCASTQTFSKPEEAPVSPQKEYSRHMLLKSADGSFANLQFKGTKSVELIASTNPALKNYVGNTLSLEQLRQGIWRIKTDGNNPWVTTWIFWPDGTARVHEGSTKNQLAIPVKKGSIKWPLKEGEEASYRHKRHMLMDYVVDDRRVVGDLKKDHHLVGIQIIGHVISITGSTFKSLENSKWDSITPTMKLNEGAGTWTVSFINGGFNFTQDWTFYPDGTASADERPRNKKSHEVVPW